MVCPSRESIVKGEFRDHPPSKPQMLPSDPWAEEAEERLQLKRNNSMATREGGCHSGFGGRWRQYRACNGPNRRQRSKKLPDRQEGYKVPDRWSPKQRCPQEGSRRPVRRPGPA